METKRETVYERGTKAGIYTQEHKVEIIVFHSSEDKAWGAMFVCAPGLSAFGNTPEQALEEFGIVLQSALNSGLKVSELAALSAEAVR